MCTQVGTASKVVRQSRLGRDDVIDRQPHLTPGHALNHYTISALADGTAHVPAVPTLEEALQAPCDPPVVSCMFCTGTSLLNLGTTTDSYSIKTIHDCTFYFSPPVTTCFVDICSCIGNISPAISPFRVQPAVWALDKYRTSKALCSDRDRLQEKHVSLSYVRIHLSSQDSYARHDILGCLSGSTASIEPPTCRHIHTHTHVPNRATVSCMGTKLRSR